MQDAESDSKDLREDSADGKDSSAERQADQANAKDGEKKKDFQPVAMQQKPGKAKVTLLQLVRSLALTCVLLPNRAILPLFLHLESSLSSLQRRARTRMTAAVQAARHANPRSAPCCSAVLC